MWHRASLAPFITFTAASRVTRPLDRLERRGVAVGSRSAPRWRAAPPTGSASDPVVATTRVQTPPPIVSGAERRRRRNSGTRWRRATIAAALASICPGGASPATRWEQARALVYRSRAHGGERLQARSGTGWVCRGNAGGCGELGARCVRGVARIADDHGHGATYRCAPAHPRARAWLPPDHTSPARHAARSASREVRALRSDGRHLPDKSCRSCRRIRLPGQATTSGGGWKRDEI